ncbi:GrpB family protein [Anoxybacter fermentans]|uniref:GrpB family protein n=1 Tax=Anoxybacter fermentans TaxID=1323375 RepID=UPI00196AAD6A|nr:GrpB family protein [Anoxybacter fermentans]
MRGEFNLLGLKRGIVKLHPYTNEWKRLYEEEKNLLWSSIGNYVVDIQHIGSTSIPGIEAKPIIDIMVGVRNLEDGEKCVEFLEKLGYEYKGEHGIPGRLFFAKGDSTMRTHHLHMVEWNSDFWRNHLLFRNYLRKHEDVAEEYLKLKRELAEKFAKDRDAYTAGKADFIQRVLKKADISGE